MSFNKELTIDCFFYTFKMKESEFKKFVIKEKPKSSFAFRKNNLKRTKSSLENLNHLSNVSNVSNVSNEGIYYCTLSHLNDLNLSYVFDEYFSMIKKKCKVLYKTITQYRSSYNSYYKRIKT